MCIHAVHNTVPHAQCNILYCIHSLHTCVDHYSIDFVAMYVDVLTVIITTSASRLQYNLDCHHTSSGMLQHMHTVCAYLHLLQDEQTEEETEEVVQEMQRSGALQPDVRTWRTRAL